MVSLGLSYIELNDFSVLSPTRSESCGKVRLMDGICGLEDIGGPKDKEKEWLQSWWKKLYEIMNNAKDKMTEATFGPHCFFFLSSPLLCAPLLCFRGQISILILSRCTFILAVTICMSYSATPSSLVWS